MKIKNFFPYGTVLKIEREYTRGKIAEMLKQIKDANMNFVVIWPCVYWWEDKKSPSYPFATGQFILETAQQLGLKVIMELAGQIACHEYMPDFKMKREYFTVDENGSYKNKAFSFEAINYNHPEVIKQIEEIFAKTALAYKDFPALYGYDIWNETDFRSFDIYTLELFREWLKNKYCTIENFNRVWERSVDDWSQIEFSFWRWASLAPESDYQEFLKEQIGVVLRRWRDIVKSVDGEKAVIADNIGSMIVNDWAYLRPQDDWIVAENVDEFGISFYPKDSEESGLNHCARWETFSGARAASVGGTFWISEMQSHSRSLLNSEGAVFPHELKWWCYEGISNGAKGLIYWKWRPFSKGHQAFGRGLITIDNRSTPRLEAAKEIASTLKRYEREFSEFLPQRSNVAILYDKRNHDIIKALSKTTTHNINTKLYTDSIAAIYKSLWEKNIRADFITPKELNGCDYSVVFATQQLIVSEEMACEIEMYISKGGSFITDGAFGAMTEEGVMNESLPGGTLAKKLDFRLNDIYTASQNITLADGTVISAFNSMQLLETMGKKAEIIGRYSDDSPAIIANKIGKGELIHIGTDLWHDSDLKSAEVFLSFLQKKHSLSDIILSCNDVKFSVLEGNNEALLFLFNYVEADRQICVEMKKRTVDYMETVSGENALLSNGSTISCAVKGQQVAILKLKYWECR